MYITENEAKSRLKTTNLGEVHEIAECAAPVQDDVLAGVVRGSVAVGSFRPREFDKRSAISDENVAGGNGSGGLLNRGIINEKVLTITTGTKDGDRAKDGVRIKSGGWLKGGCCEWIAAVESRLTQCCRRWRGQRHE